MLDGWLGNFNRVGNHFPNNRGWQKTLTVDVPTNFDELPLQAIGTNKI